MKHEVFVVRGSGKAKRVLCAECLEPVALLTLDEAVKISGMGSRAIYRLIEAGRIHFKETPDRVALICPATLVRRLSKEQDR